MMMDIAGGAAPTASPLEVGDAFGLAGASVEALDHDRRTLVWRKRSKAEAAVAAAKAKRSGAADLAGCS